MTLLAPAAGIIGAALAVPALLLLYFLKLKRRPLRVSSVLLWEQAARDLQVNVPLRMIRWSWVLLLQLLALACLLVALARPAVPGAGPAGSRIIILIDCSASMSAADGGIGPAGVPRTRLDLARERALELIDSLGRAGSTRARAMVIALDASPRALTRFTSNLGELREAVREIAPTDQPDDLAAAMRLVEAMTAEADGEETDDPAAVYLISDGGHAALSPQDRRGVFVRHVYAGPVRSAGADPRADNLGIVAISAQRDPDDPALVRVFARIQNAGPQDVSIAARCTLDGRVPEGGVRAVAVPGATAGPDGTIEPGEAGVHFSIRQSDAGIEQVVVVDLNREDLLSADNAAGLVLPAVWRPRVLLVAPDGDPAPQPDVFLRQALEATEPATIRILGGTEFGAMAATALQVGGDGRRVPWRGFDLVVLDRVGPEVWPDVPTLSFGAPPMADGVELTGGPEPGGRSVARVIAWRRNHPALRYVSLDTLIVAPGIALRVPAESHAGSGGRAAEFTELVDGTFGPLLIEIEHDTDAQAGAGRVMRRIAAAFALERSNWGPDVSFPVFIANAVEWLTESSGPSRLAWSIDTGARLPVVAPAAAGSVIARTGTANLERVFAVSPAASDVSTGLVGPLDRVGVWRLAGATQGAVEPEVVAVNLISPRESLIAVRPRAALGPGARAGALGEGSAADGRGRGGEREVWHWFVLAALGLLSIEWFVYAWRMRA